MFDTSLQAAAAEDALHRWSSPWPGFTSGHDPRTSDNALLVQTYGSVEHAAAHDWQNAGRRLVDKTYIHMLWHVQGLLPMKAATPERIAAGLDPFVRDELARLRTEIDSLDPSLRHQRSLDLVSLAASSLFASLTSDVAASRLLFYLCPRLPVHAMTRSAVLTLGLPLEVRYADFAEKAEHAMQSLELPMRVPDATAGSRADRARVNELLATTDWWQRRVFQSACRLHARESFGLTETPDDCRDDGSL